MSLRGACKATKQSPFYEAIASGKIRPRNDIIFIVMRVFALILIVLFLVSCSPVQTTQSLGTSTANLVVSTQTFAIILPTETPTPVIPTETPTLSVCDPRIVDYCITDGHFILQRPIEPPDNTSVDVTYR